MSLLPAPAMMGTRPRQRLQLWRAGQRIPEERGSGFPVVPATTNASMPWDTCSSTKRRKADRFKLLSGGMG